ncbi:MipA/OmpV family protein [Colwellia sp. RE-S-Sl-9]
MKLTKNLLYKIKLTLGKAVLVALCFFPQLSFAVEQQLDKETTLFNQTFSWQVMMGLSVYSSHSPLKDVKQEDVVDYMSLSIMIDLYYKGFFIQSNHRRSVAITQGAEVGYQLHVDNDWSVDILTKTYITGYDPDILIEKKNQSIPTLEGLKEREIGDAIALRYSRFNDDSIFSIDFANLTHWSKANGWLIDVYYNEVYIYKNWDIYIGGGVTYYSNQVMDYYYGIKEEEVTNARAYYDPNTGFKGTFEVYAQYPISKKWSFSAGVTQTYYSNTIGKSPLIDRQNITQFLLGVIYVF